MAWVARDDDECEVLDYMISTRKPELNAGGMWTTDIRHARHTRTNMTATLFHRLFDLRLKPGDRVRIGKIHIPVEG